MIKVGINLLPAFMAAICHTGVAYSQDASRLTLEEVVVTAQKTSESLGDVAIAISALPAVNLEDFGADNLLNVANSVPGVVFSRATGGLALIIRGLGSPAGTQSFALLSYG